MIRVDFLAERLRDHKGMRRKEDWLVSVGFRLIGGGCSKHAYRSPDGKLVVRVYNAHLTTQEADNYRDAPEGSRRYLVPLLAYGIGFQIQEYVEGVECPGRGKCPVTSWYDVGIFNHVHDPVTGEPRVYDYGTSGFWTKTEDE